MRAVMKFIGICCIIMFINTVYHFKQLSTVEAVGEVASKNTYWEGSQQYVIVRQYFNAKVSSFESKTITLKAFEVGVPDDYSRDGSWISYASKDVLDAMRRTRKPNVGDSVMVDTTINEQLGLCNSFIVALCVALTLTLLLSSRETHREKSTICE